VTWNAATLVYKEACHGQTTNAQKAATNVNIHGRTKGAYLRFIDSSHFTCFSKSDIEDNF
jgi:hypothetical protein